MRTAAILPVKRFAAAKQRLGESVPDAVRLQLARAMVTDVLEALERTAGIELTILVTGQEDLARTAAEHGAEVVEDRSDSGQSAAVTLGVQRALGRSFERVLCVPGDCPALDPGELRALLARRAATQEVVIVPDRHGSGTNALLLCPPDAIEPSFGPDSFARHRALAHAAGLHACERDHGALRLGDDLVRDHQQLPVAQRRGAAERVRDQLREVVAGADLRQAAKRAG